MGGLPLNDESWASLLKECDKNNDGEVNKNIILIYLKKFYYLLIFFNRFHYQNFWIY